MTIFQVEELCEYWREHPPVHLLVAGFVGFKPEPVSHVEPNVPMIVTLSAIPGLAAAAPDDLPAPIFDVGQLLQARPH